MYIAIAGNIGSGKTSLTDILTQRLGGKAYYEDINNPYIGDFYDDMSRWSFNFQVYFLGSRIKQTIEVQEIAGYVFQDRTIFEDAHIFADNLHQMGLMTSRDFDTYMKIFSLATSLLKFPDLLIYLRASVPTLVNHILTRGRSYEKNIDLEYLQRLNNKYNSWIENIYPGKVLTIDVDKTDFVANPAMIDDIIAQIKSVEQTIGQPTLGF